MKEGVFLEGNEIYLRLLSREDIEGGYSNWLNDEEVCKYNSHHRFPVTKNQLINYIENTNQSKDILVLAIILKNNGVHIGNVSLQSINYIDKTAEIAFITGEKQYWGKGFTKEASKLILQHAFLTLNLNRVYCGTHQDNIPMQKLAESLGFKKEGIRREAIFKNGQYKDIVEYGLLKKEFTNQEE